jgi:hypothetical protein
MGTRVPLLSGAYKQDNLLFQAQRCINLYAEQMAQDSQQTVPVIHYQTPGGTLLGTCPVPGNARCYYIASNDDVYAVVNANVYFIDAGYGYNLLGSIQAGTTPVSMADNSLCILLVDGTSTAYSIDLQSRNFAAVGDPNYPPSDRVEYLDSFFLLHPIGTNIQRGQMQISLGNVTQAQLTATTGGTAFNALDIVSKNGYPDPIGAFKVVHREIWLVGTQTTEIWYDSAASDFPFAPLPGAMVEHGILAPWSLAAQDLSTFWLSKDKQGNFVIVRGTGYTVKRISTHAIERQFATYPSPTDAYGFCFQILGHAFYGISFRNADRTWLFDLQTNEWLEWAYFDTNGAQHRQRPFNTINAYGKVTGLDWATGNIIQIDSNSYTEFDGNAIHRLRSFPHMIADGKLVTYDNLQIDFQPGTLAGLLATPNPFVPTFDSTEPIMQLRWSDNRGASYGNPLYASMGSTGEYDVSLIFNNLGQARDRVFEVSWSAPMNTDLKGGWVEFTPCAS